MGGGGNNNFFIIVYPSKYLPLHFICLWIGIRDIRVMVHRTACTIHDPRILTIDPLHPPTMYVYVILSASWITIITFRKNETVSSSGAYTVC